MTVLRYPGGKRKLTPYVETFIRAHVRSPGRFCEPYAGSASVGIGLLQGGIINELLLVEADVLVACFWKCVFEDGVRLASVIDAVDVNMEQWSYFRRYLEVSQMPASREERLELALAFLFLNRTCYSGILNAGPIGGKEQSSDYDLGCRFNKRRISNLIRNLVKLGKRVTVLHDDAINVLSESSNKVMCFYVDPPYYVQGRKLYRSFYTDVDHMRLAECLSDVTVPWLLSYDDHEFIRNCYEYAKVGEYFFDYSVRTARVQKELLISNCLLPPIYLTSAQLEFEVDPVCTLQRAK